MFSGAATLGLDLAVSTVGLGGGGINTPEGVLDFRFSEVACGLVGRAGLWSPVTCGDITPRDGPLASPSLLLVARE